MSPAEVKTKLCEVLKNIQVLSGEKCPPLEGDICPAKSLPKFNSKVWPVAAGMLGLALGRRIPPSKNLFVDKATKTALTIDQTVQLVCQLLSEEKQPTQGAVAA